MLAALHDGFIIGVFIVGAVWGTLLIGTLSAIVIAFAWGLISAVESFINKERTP